jgi:FkbM family methyltransferase
VTAFLSYAQNGEDFTLWRALHDVNAGTYIDIGAYDPDTDSVTRAFYDRGWSGINIEPVDAYWEQLHRARPRDVNLRLAVGAESGERDFFNVDDTGLSTLDRMVAERHRVAGFTVVPTRVNVRTLREIWCEFVRGEVHFLKIDVEGGEADVLVGADLAHQRPWIIVLEATAPLTRRPTHAEWEPLLTQASYRFVHADHVNRYYVAEERSALADRLSEPPGAARFVRAAELVATRTDLPPAARFDPARSPFLGSGQPVPSLRAPTSQLCTRSQLAEPAYREWSDTLCEAPSLHRKLWEYIYTLQALAIHGVLEPGRRGLGLGCGREPLAAVMASRGCEIVATALNASTAASEDRIDPGEHVRAVDDLNDRGICDPERFRERVTLHRQDRYGLPTDLEEFDFVWSMSMAAHVGSIRGGLDFVVDAMRCLKPGGVAVHTTEFNLSSNYTTLEARDLVIFRRCDIDELIRRVERAGHAVAPLNLNPGSDPVDRYVDLPPYRPEPHLRVRLDRYATTSIGLIIRKQT